MLFIVIILLLSLLFAVLGLPIFELTCATLLLSVVLQFLAEIIFGSSSVISILVLILVATSLSLPKLLKLKGKFTKPDYEEIVAQSVFIISMLACWGLALNWPDFISIGERLRDYALLSSVIQYPTQALEPWMSGYSLNYYLFWYRLGHLINQLTALPIWHIYHILQALTFAIFIGAVFRLSRKWLKFSVFYSAFTAILIAFGSNLSGVWYFANRDHNWWGPSRVIPGAINEFPAWSFLLGDLHPHFLNLGLLPFFLLLGLEFSPLLFRVAKLKLSFLAGLIAITYCLWIYNANAWELPYGLFVLASLLLVGFLFRKSLNYNQSPGISSKALAILILVIVTMLCLLYLSSRNIKPLDAPLRLVLWPLQSLGIVNLVDSLLHYLPIKISPAFPADTSQAPVVVGSQFIDLFRHWGFPLTLVVLSQAVLFRSIYSKLSILVLFLAAALSGHAFFVLILLLVVSLARLYFESSSERSIELHVVAVEAFGLASIGAIFFPEVIFFDDPYGGENERMNTIFKFYSASWSFFHIYAFYLVAKVLSVYKISISDLRIKYGIAAITLVLMCGFFVQTLQDRMQKSFSMTPAAQGLSSIEQNFPGGGVVVQKLEKMPRGIVLESQGGAYNYSSFVSTLSSNFAYLGWANHVNLLTREDSEVRRREQVSEEIYTNPDCSRKQTLLKTDKIKYLVFGTLEKQKYPGISQDVFACLNQVLSERDYTIYQVD